MSDDIKKELLFALYDLQMNKEDAVVYVLNQLKDVNKSEVEAAYEEVYNTLTY